MRLGTWQDNKYRESDDTPGPMIYFEFAGLLLCNAFDYCFAFLMQSSQCNALSGINTWGVLAITT
jgi:hypothetical protein